MRKNYLNNGRVLLVSLFTALTLVACGGGGGSSAGVAISDPVLQAGLIAPKNMGGTAIVGQEYKGLVEVIPYDSSVTVVSLSITNNTAGGSVPSIDLAGNITWVPNEQDFAGTASLRVTGKLSSGALVADNVPLDVRKVRVVLQRTLGVTDQVYSDTDNLYSISITKKTAGSIISGELIVKEAYRKNGEYSWFFEAKGDGFNATVLQAPTTQLSPLSNTASAATTQVGVVQAYPVLPLSVGSGDFSDISENGSVVGHQLVAESNIGGNNVYTSRPAGHAIYYKDNLSDIRSAPLDGFAVFWFGSNCAPINVNSIITGAGSLSNGSAVATSCASRAQSKSPIILIHGFSGADNIAWNESIVGGGAATWGQTANLLTEQGYPVFEMRWMSYMPFEDAAGALAKFGKDIAKITGKKPIILAHSFGGVVSHMALQNKGREWKSPEYGVGHWESVNSDGVFAKLITLDSPLSGINADGGVATGYAGFNPFKKIYDAAGNLQDVAFPRGVDRTDSLIKLCYAITCAQAGALFNNNASFKSLAINKSLIDGYSPTLYIPPSKVSIYDAEIVGGVSRGLKEGETIADMQTGISQAKDNAPYLTVVGFRPFLYESYSTSISRYDLGDGLISLMGQAAIPQDFSDNAFDTKSNASFKFKFEYDSYPATLGGTVKFAALEKGNCLEYGASSRNYLICGYAAHTSSMVIAPGPGFSNGVVSYAVAAYDGTTLKHVIPSLVYGIKYMSISPQDSPFANQASLASVISGRLGASVAAKQVGVVSSASLSPIKSALIWATIVEKSTGISKHYFNGSRSDDSGNFTIDVGSVVSSKFGANAVLSNYSVKLKIDVVGYQSWTKTIDSLGAVINLGDIDLSLASSSVDFATVLAGGTYEAGSCLLNPVNCQEVRYYKMTGKTGIWQSSQYDLGSGGWGASASGGADEYLTASGWVNGSVNGGNSGTFTSDGLGGGTATNSRGSSIRFVTTMLDLSGKTASAIAGLTVPSALASKTFPIGSTLYWMKSQKAEDEYRVWTGNTMDAWTCATPSSCSSTPLTSIAGLLVEYSSGGSQKVQWNDVIFSFDSGATSTGGTVSLWSSQSATVKSGSAPYEIRTVFGQQVLIIKAPTSRVGEFVMFAVHGGLLRGGTYVSSNTYTQGNPWFNKTAMNAIMSALGKPAVAN